MFAYRIDDELELKLLEGRHAESGFALVDRNREHLREWMPWVDGTSSVDDVKAFIKRSLTQFAENNGFVLGIWYRSEQVGNIGVNSVNWAFRKAEVGYWIDAAYQGKGIVTRSCRAVMQYLFEEMNVSKIEIHVAEKNERSRAVPERLGFVQEGVLRRLGWHSGGFEGLVVYGMLSDEWGKTGN